MANVDISAKDISQNYITVNLTVKRYTEWRIRLWIALRIIEFAAWLAWVNIEIKDESQEV